MTSSSKSSPVFFKLAMQMLLQGTGGRSAAMLLASLVIAVSVVATLTLTTDRIQGLVYAKASQFLAADATISGSMPIPESWQLKAQQQSLATASAINFRAMVFSSSENPLMQLGAIKAVSSSYPLKGQLVLADQPFEHGNADGKAPASGQAWLTSRLFSALDIKVGGNIAIGDAVFTVSKALIQEPDSPQSVFGFAPRVIINIDDVAKTGAVAEGSRVNYSLMLKGNNAVISQFKQDVALELGNHFKWRSAGEGDGPDAGVFQRITSYITLVASLALVLGAVAIALAADEFSKNQIKNVALLKTLGLGPNAIARLYLWKILIISVVGSVCGLIAGWIFHLGLMQLIAVLVPNEMPLPQYLAYFIPVLAGMSVLVVFAGPPLWQLRQVSPAAALRVSYSVATKKHWWFGMLLIVALIAVLTQQVKLTILAALALVIAFYLVRLLIAASFRAVTQLHQRSRGALRIGLGQWLNYRWQNATQATVFGLIFMVLFSVYSARTHLLNAWAQQVPKDAPNHFVFNIYDHQKAAVEEFIAEQANNPSLFYAMTRGRITEVNGLAWKDQIAKQEKEISRNFDRELNLTWAETLQDDNEIIAGKWWSSTGENDALLISIEKDYAEGSGIKVGDRILLSLAGQEVLATVANIRTLNWQSMRPNFFIIFNRKPMPFVASNWITSFYLPPDKKLAVNALIQQFPSVTLVEIDQTLATIKQLVNQLGKAVEYLLSLMILAAIMVLTTGMLVTLPQRLRTSALMRAFGGNSQLIRNALIIEFLLLGLVAGLVACLGTELLVRFWLANALNIERVGFLSVWLWGIPLAIIVLLVAGVLSTRKALLISPSQLLKAAL